MKEEQRQPFAILESFAPLRDLDFAQPAGNPTVANGARTLLRKGGWGGAIWDSKWFLGKMAEKNELVAIKTNRPPHNTKYLTV